MSELQHNQKQYFALLTETCRQISLALNSHRILRKKLPINEVKIYMSDNFSNPNLNLACTARQFDVSEGYLSSCFKEATGICFADHLENIRIKKACELLASSDKTIVEIAEKQATTACILSDVLSNAWCTKVHRITGENKNCSYSGNKMHLNMN